MSPFIQSPIPQIPVQIPSQGFTASPYLRGQAILPQAYPAIQPQTYLQQPSVFPQGLPLQTSPLGALPQLIAQQVVQQLVQVIPPLVQQIVPQVLQQQGYPLQQPFAPQLQVSGAYDNSIPLPFLNQPMPAALYPQLQTPGTTPIVH